MKKYFYHLLAKITGKNTTNTPVDVISEQLNEVRQLPLGDKEFEEWSDRIISGVPTLYHTERTSMKFALATMIMQLGPQESHKPDIYFLKTLLKGAANQVAHAKLTFYKEEAKKKAEEEALERSKLATEATLARMDPPK